MIKYLFFQNDSVDNTIYPNDSALIPTERLMGMELNADGTDLTLSFKKHASIQRGCLSNSFVYYCR